MRLRIAVAAFAAATAVVLGLPGTALAADGQFHYTFVDATGTEQRATLQDPYSGECINLRAVGSDDLRPGYAPHNQTASWVTVFQGADCNGPPGPPAWRLPPRGEPAGAQLEVRSVRFYYDGARYAAD